MVRVMLVIHACRWQNPLIGWTSTGDPMEHVARSALNFRSKEEAVAFAEKQGFVPVVREPQRRRPDRLKRYAGYGDNFRCCCALCRRNVVPQLPADGAHVCTSTLAGSWLQSHNLHDVTCVILLIMPRQAMCGSISWCCSVKRHGYPIGGMRSESPVKKQAATEEMHMEVRCKHAAE